MDVQVHQSAPNYALHYAVLLYGANPNSIDLVTHHPVGNTKSGPVILEGQPASKEALLALFDSIAQRVKRPIRLLQENVLAISDDCLLWWEPAQSRRIAFSCKELGKRAATVPHPPLLFAVVREEWFVFALTENVRPTETTTLSVAPYFNVWVGGKICTGTTALPKADKRSAPEAWTKAFFQSAFTHPNVHEPGGLVAYKTGPFAFWRDMLDGKFKAFPTECLVQTRYTVKNMLAVCHEGASHA